MSLQFQLKLPPEKSEENGQKGEKFQKFTLGTRKKKDLHS